MRITISNKTLKDKPQPSGMGNFLGSLQFGTRELKWSHIRESIEKGYTLTYIYKDTDFSYSGYNKKDNYLGTEYIIVDIDKCEISPSEFVKGIHFKPTIWHTTFSNLTERKDNKYCFHLIYCLTEMVYGEKNFATLLETLTSDYTEYVDPNAKDCHRIIFTSNKELPNFEYSCSGILYDPSMFLEDLGDTEDKSEEKELKEIAQTKNDFQLSEGFFADLMSMGRREFLGKYLFKYPPLRNSVIPEDLIHISHNGITYADLRGFSYYEVPSKYRFDSSKGKGQVKKVQIGERQRQLFIDISLFMQCNPSISKEGLVTAILDEVWQFYDNSDKELTNHRIIELCASLWDSRPKMKATGKKFKILETSNPSMSKMEAVGSIRKLFKDEELGNLLDLSLTVEENLTLLKNNGMGVKRIRLLQFCSEYGISLMTDKDKRNSKIKELRKKFPSASLRELEGICKAMGIDVTRQTITKILV